VFRFSPIKYGEYYSQYKLAIGPLYIAFIILRYVRSMPSFFRAFTKKGCWIMSKAFFCICWDDHVIFVLDSMCCIILTDLCMLNHPCIPGMEPTWS
jgi:hypothetical protein